MRLSRRAKKIAFFVTLGTCLAGLGIALNVAWIVLKWREVVPLVLGIIFFALIIAGIVVYTVFLVREIRKNEQQDSFLHAVTHELKTPIASIRLYLETLQSREVDENKRREFNSVMLADTDRLHNTVEQVLRAGFDGAGAKPAYVRLELDSLVAECAELARRRHHLDEAHLKMKRPATPLTVVGDAEQLHTAVVNLLDNAVKYSTGDVQINVELAATNGKAQVCVQDKGAGIPSRELEKVFDRFYRVSARSTRKVGGTGLGLYIVKNIAKRHGGRVFAQSEGEGKGSVFILELPLDAA